MLHNVCTVQYTVFILYATLNNYMQHTVPAPYRDAPYRVTPHGLHPTGSHPTGCTLQGHTPRAAPYRVTPHGLHPTGSHPTGCTLQGHTPQIHAPQGHTPQYHTCPWYFYSSPQAQYPCTMALCTATAVDVSVHSLQSGKWVDLEVPNSFTMKLFDSGSSHVLKFTSTDQQVC